MADINRLAFRAAEIRVSKNALTDAEAIGKAIRGQGITFPPDVERLMKEVGTVFAQNKRRERRSHASRR